MVTFAPTRRTTFLMFFPRLIGVKSLRTARITLPPVRRILLNPLVPCRVTILKATTGALPGAPLPTTSRYPKVSR